MQFWNLFLFHLQRVLNPFHEESLVSPLPVDLTWLCYISLFALEFFLFQKKKQIQYEGWLAYAHVITTNIFSVIAVLFSCILGYVYYLQKTESLSTVFLNCSPRDWVLMYWLYIQIYIMVGTVLLPKKKWWIGRLFWFVTFRHHLDGEVVLICSLDSLSILSSLSPSWLPTSLSNRLPRLTTYGFFLHAYANTINPQVPNYPSFWLSVAMLNYGWLYPVTILDYLWGPWVSFILMALWMLWLSWSITTPGSSGGSWVGTGAVNSIQAILEQRERDIEASRIQAASRWQVDPESQVPEVSEPTEPPRSSDIRDSARKAITSISNISNMISQPKADSCVICLEQPRELCIRPCHHWCLCNECAKKMQDHALTETSGVFQRCPICSGAVEGVFRIYS